MHARSEHAREGEGDQSTDEQHDEGGDELPLAQLDEREINLRKRQGQADYDRGISGLVVALSAVHQFVAEKRCDARTGLFRGPRHLETRADLRGFPFYRHRLSESTRTRPVLSMMVTRAPLRAARLVQLRSSMGSVERGGLAKARPRREASWSLAERMAWLRMTRAE